MNQIEEHDTETKMHESTYGKAYLTWKAWGNKFGEINQLEKNYFSKEISRANRFLPQNSKALEIGFGDGKFLQYATEKNWDICGTEINNELVKIANQTRSHVES